MQANPENFQAMAIGKKSRDEFTSFSVNGTDVLCEQEVKLLGITIDFMLSFNTHISNLCKKTSHQLNVLKRIGKYLTLQGKIAIYHSFILSNFNFCPLTWQFGNETNLQKLNIQFRVLKFIYDNYDGSYENILEKSKFSSLQVRRLRTMAIETYKI